VHRSTRRQESARPAFLTGTSAEFLGDRPLPRVLLVRPHIVVLGPAGSGKTRVARRLAGPDARYLDRRATQNALVQQVRKGRWNDDLADAAALVLDGPVWLAHRPAAVHALRDLLDLREAAGRRTILCQDPGGGSVYPLIDGRIPGSTVLLGLRFPEGRGRRRHARRLCDERGWDADLASGLERLEPWSYDRVRAELEAREAARRSAEAARSVGLDEGGDVGDRSAGGEHG
jgi:hypothetical protein